MLSTRCRSPSGEPSIWPSRCFRPTPVALSAPADRSQGTGPPARSPIEKAARSMESYVDWAACASGEQAMVGETPNLAARLLGMAEPGRVVVAESTRKLVGKLFELHDLGAQELKGIAEPVRAWAALRASLVESRFGRDQGKVQQAHELLAPAYGWFTEGFDTR